MDFSPLTTRQRSLLEEIEGLKKTLEDFHGLPFQVQPSELEATLPDINKLTAKALRSGIIKRDVDGHWRLHPELPDWANRYFSEWIKTRRALGDRKSLRKARIGLERGVKRPFSLRQLRLKDEVLRLRDVREQDVSGEFGPAVRPEQEKKGIRPEPKKRVRKEMLSWKRVIQRLVQDKLLERPISHQGLKKMLKNLFHNIDWDKV